MDEATTAALDAGMRVQLGNLRAALAGGMPRAGWKVAINDPAAQRRLGINSPVLGWLAGRSVLASGATFAIPEGHKLRVEVEVCVRVGADVAADSTLAQASAAIAGIAPALEIVNATSMPGSLQAFAESNFIHLATVVGSERTYEGRLEELPALEVNGAFERAGLEGRVDPQLGELVLLVARTLARYGETLATGDRIICGSYIDPAPIVAGSRLRGVFPELGAVEVAVAG